MNSTLSFFKDCQLLLKPYLGFESLMEFNEIIVCVFNHLTCIEFS